jgi:hypothetical protein
MEKEFVPYTEALKLKELGFDEPCFKVVEGGPTDIFPYEKLDVPIYQQAFRWFREKHEIEATTACFYSKRLDIPYEERQYHCHIIRDGVTSKGPKYKTYEEAELACLKKLIEIVEQKEK